MPYCCAGSAGLNMRKKPCGEARRGKRVRCSNAAAGICKDLPGREKAAIFRSAPISVMFFYKQSVCQGRDGVSIGMVASNYPQVKTYTFGVDIKF